MPTCEVCGNDYEDAMTIERRGESHTFDSFECAIHALAPTCEHCGCRVIGHGVEADGRVFCWTRCAEESGSDALADRACAASAARSCSTPRSARGHGTRSPGAPRTRSRGR